jgi:hypothetical protein
MDILTAFKNWYARFGVRTTITLSENTHWHEEYQKIAFVGGVNWATQTFLPKYEKEINRQAKEIRKLKQITEKLLKNK